MRLPDLQSDLIIACVFVKYLQKSQQSMLQLLTYRATTVCFFLVCFFFGRIEPHIRFISCMPVRSSDRTKSSRGVVFFVRAEANGSGRS